MVFSCPGGSFLRQFVGWKMWQTVAGCRGGKQVQIQNPLALKYQLAKIGPGSAAGAAALRYFDHKPHKPHACSWRLLFWSGEDISQSSTCSRFHKETMVKQRLHWVKVQESCWKAKMFVPLEKSDHFSWQNAGTATGLRDDCWWLNGHDCFSASRHGRYENYHWYGTPSFLTNPKWVWLCDL